MKISKKVTKMITVLTLVLAVLFSATALLNGVYATSYPDISPVGSGADSSLTNIAGMFLSVAQIIGAAVAVVMLIVLAIKYLSAAPNDKAQIKQHAVVYIVGAIVLFAASALLGLLKSFVSNF